MRYAPYLARLTRRAIGRRFRPGLRISD
jgi:hypothetical protein